MTTAPVIGELLAAVEGDRPDARPGSDAAVNVREIRRAYDRAVKLPQRLVEELARVTTQAQQVWQEARQAERLRGVPAVAGKDRRAEARGSAGRRLQGRPLRRPARRVRAGRRHGGDHARLRGPARRTWPRWSQAIAASGRQAPREILAARYPVDRQQAFGQAAAAAIGFDFDAGRLDTTTHPFCSGIGPGDCRITTRYNPRFFNESFFGILHEAGHGIYEQGLPAEHYGTPRGSRRVAGHPRIAIAVVGESGRPRPAVLGALLSQGASRRSRKRCAT